MSFRHLLRYLKTSPKSPSARGSSEGPEAEADDVRQLIHDAYQAGLAAGSDAGFRAGFNGTRGEIASALVATLKQLMRLADAADLNETLALTIRCHHEELRRDHVKNAGMEFPRWS